MAAIGSWKGSLPPASGGVAGSKRGISTSWSDVRAQWPVALTASDPFFRYSSGSPEMNATQSFGKTSVMKIRSPTPQVITCRPTRRSSAGNRRWRSPSRRPPSPPPPTASKMSSPLATSPQRSPRGSTSSRARPSPRTKDSSQASRRGGGPRGGGAAGGGEGPGAGPAGRRRPSGRSRGGAAVPPPRQLPPPRQRGAPRGRRGRVSPDEFRRGRPERAPAEEIGRELEVVAHVGEHRLRGVPGLDVLHEPLRHGPEPLNLADLLGREHARELPAPVVVLLLERQGRRAVDPRELAAEVDAAGVLRRALDDPRRALAHTLLAHELVGVLLGFAARDVLVAEGPAGGARG